MPDITEDALVAAWSPSPATEHATEEQLEAALVNAGVLPSQATIAAESLIDSKARFTDSAKPTADTINAIMDIHDETRLLAANELERAIALQTSVDRLNTDLSDANQRIGALSAGIRIINDALSHEAAERDWCGEYESFLDRVNDRLPAGVPKLEMPVRRYHISFFATCTESVAKSLEAAVDSELQDNDFGVCSHFELDGQDDD